MADFNKSQGDRKQGDIPRDQPNREGDRNRDIQKPGSSQPGSQAPIRGDQTKREDKREKSPGRSPAEDASEIDAEEQPNENRNL